MQRRNFMTAFAVGLAGWISKAALPAEAQEPKKPQETPNTPSTPGTVPPQIYLSKTLAPQSAAEHKIEQDREDWIRKAALEIGTIRVGMTRADLLKIFTTEGGISTRMNRMYVYRECWLIKVEVEFQPVPEKHDKEGRIMGEEAPEDIITKISRPFIVAFNIYD